MKKNRSTIYIITVIITTLAITYFSAIKAPIPEENTGIRIRFDKIEKTYLSGEKPFILPIVDKYLIIPNGEKTLHLTGKYAILYKTSDNKEELLEAKLVYRINDNTLFLQEFGYDNPLSLLEKGIRDELTIGIQTNLQGNVAAINNTRNRILLIAGLHVDLNEKYSPVGVQLDNFEISVK